jgi:hypothetical protein
VPHITAYPAVVVGFFWKKTASAVSAFALDIKPTRAAAADYQ